MDYVVGSIAALLSGNVTPNRPQRLRNAQTPIKHQPSPNVTPKSECLEDRSIFLSPTMQKKKAILKKSPKRIFQNPDLDVTNGEDNDSSPISPKADKVKKHLKDELEADPMVLMSQKSPKNSEMSPKKGNKKRLSESIVNEKIIPQKKQRQSNVENDDSVIHSEKENISLVTIKSPKKKDKGEKSLLENSESMLENNNSPKKKHKQQNELTNEEINIRTEITEEVTTISSGIDNQSPKKKKNRKKNKSKQNLNDEIQVPSSSEHNQAINQDKKDLESKMDDLEVDVSQVKTSKSKKSKQNKGQTESTGISNTNMEVDVNIEKISGNTEATDNQKPKKKNKKKRKSNKNKNNNQIDLKTVKVNPAVTSQDTDLGNESDDENDSGTENKSENKPTTDNQSPKKKKKRRKSKKNKLNQIKCGAIEIVKANLNTFTNQDSDSDDENHSENKNISDNIVTVDNQSPKNKNKKKRNSKKGKNNNQVESVATENVKVNPITVTSQDTNSEHENDSENKNMSDNIETMKKKKSKNNKNQVETETTETVKVNPNAVTSQDTDSEHDSDDEIDSENEEINKKALDTGPADDSSDDQAPVEEKINKKGEKKIGQKYTDEEIKRTLFVGNVPLTPKTKKEIKKIFSKYGKIETVRIRTVPVKDARDTPKLAVIKQDLHPDRSTVHVYVRFSTANAVQKALVENNTVMDKWHLRVHAADSTGVPHDARCSVFVGNIPFTLEDEALRTVFTKCGEIDSVRIVRDKATCIGKGFGYVNFKSKDAVELALAMTEDDLNVKNRILRVKRCTQPTDKQLGKKEYYKSAKQQNTQPGKKFGGGRQDFGKKTNFGQGGGQNDDKNSGAYRRVMNKRKSQESGEGPPNKRQNIDQPQREKKERKEFVGMTAGKKKKNKFDKGLKKKKALSEILTK